MHSRWPWTGIFAFFALVYSLLGAIFIMVVKWKIDGIESVVQSCLP